MNWLKLVGATDRPLPEDWEHEAAHIFTELRFPWNKPPSDIWSPGRIVLYAVGSTAVIATQSVDGPPHINPRRGPARSRDNRWPHSIKVVTHNFCSPLSSAPLLRDVAAEFAGRYAKRFRNGSHWQISDEEYGKLAAAIESHGRQFQT